MLTIATSMDALTQRTLLESGLDGRFKFHDINDAISNPDIAEECEGIWVTLFPLVDESLLKYFPKLKFVASPTTGLTHIDVELLKSRKIELFSLQGQSDFLKGISATPEFAWGLMLSVWRKIPLSASQYDGDTSIRTRFSSRQLRGRNVGILGFGRVGKYLFKYANAFEMKTHFYDPYISTNNSDDFPSASNSLEELLENSDIVFVSASVRKSEYSRYPLLNKENISYLKKDSIVINISRGILVDENELAKALREERIFGIGTDVLLREELDNVSDELSPLEIARNDGLNVIITPHLAGMCDDAFFKCCENIARQIIQSK